MQHDFYCTGDIDAPEFLKDSDGEIVAQQCRRCGRGGLAVKVFPNCLAPLERFSAEPCGCGDKNCKDWHVDPVAAVQGVNFTQSDARAVAAFLNERHKDD